MALFYGADKSSRHRTISVIPASKRIQSWTRPQRERCDSRRSRNISGNSPEYEFIFSIKESAQARWHYTPKDAERTQTHMTENAFEVAKRSDRQKGLEIMIEGRDARRQ
jgi:hypothetical protein